MSVCVSCAISLACFAVCLFVLFDSALLIFILTFFSNEKKRSIDLGGQENGEELRGVGTGETVRIYFIKKQIFNKNKRSISHFSTNA